MRKIIFMLAVNCACVACPEEYVKISSKEELKEYIDNKQGYVIVSLDEGMKIPITLGLSGEFFSLEGESDLEICMKRPLYLFADDENIFCSLDGNEWKTFMEFFTGSVSAHTCEGGLGLSAVLNQRE